MVSLAQRIRKHLLAIAGVVESPGVFGEGDAFWVNGTQIAHFSGDDTIELRITRRGWSQYRELLRDDPRVRRRGKSSDWIDVTFASPGDLLFVLEMAEVAASAHRAPRGTTPKPPPEGADLVRRRRFH